MLPNINSPKFKNFTESLGVCGYLVIIGYVVLSHVFAPIAGSPGVTLGITIYGVSTGLWLLYIGSMISASINFYVARRFGRNRVEKFVGKDSMKKIDEFVSVEGEEALIISRLLGFAFFDFISYAAGLTLIKFKKYMIITASMGLIANLTLQYVFKNIDFQSESGIMIWIGSIFVAGIVFGIYFTQYLKKSEKNID